MLILGCIADDFTGAGDAASFLAEGGMSVQLFNGIPANPEVPSHIQAVVIALKSRTEEVQKAVEDSVSAAGLLLSLGAKHIYFKYCSTFDSTPSGNIGPVADALMDRLNCRYSILCPALPVNKRTVINGELLVDGVPLHHTHMRNHPLTPMWDSKITRLMEPQSRYPSFDISLQKLAQINTYGLCPDDFATSPFYLVPDYITEEDGEKIAKAFMHLPLLTGGSGILKPLAKLLIQSDIENKAGKMPAASCSGLLSKEKTAPAGKTIILAGSCSKITLAQIEYYKKSNKPSIKLDPDKLISGEQSLESVWQLISSNSYDEVLVYSSDEPEKVREYQKRGREFISELLEKTTAGLAYLASQNGYTSIISAGGETSGAITKRLGFDAYYIGESVAPGVPVMVPVSGSGLKLVLKSGNFGQEDFFERAVSITKGLSH